MWQVVKTILKVTSTSGCLSYLYIILLMLKTLTSELSKSLYILINILDLCEP
jgi:hypothetical protein